MATGCLCAGVVIDTAADAKSPDGSPVGDQEKSCIQIPSLQEEEN